MVLSPFFWKKFTFSVNWFVEFEDESVVVFVVSDESDEFSSKVVVLVACSGRQDENNNINISI